MDLFEAPFQYVFNIALVALVLSALAYFGHRTTPNEQGWSRISPGPMLWFGLIFGMLLSGVLTYVRLFVGSALPDEELQMQILTALVVAFGLGTSIMAYAVAQTRRLAFQWRGNWMSYSRSSGERVVRDMTELLDVEQTRFGWVLLTFSDGEKIKLSESARGIHQLAGSIIELRPDLFPNLDDTCAVD